MRVLVYPHDLEMGGSQLNAIEIAAAMQRMGHYCVIFGVPGALNARISELGLPFVAAPRPGRRPSPIAIRALLRAIDAHDIDVVHGYEWPPALEALIASRLRPRVRAVATVMSMAVAPFIPRAMPLLVGTHQIAAAERAGGRDAVAVLEPPVDLAVNDPTLPLDTDGFRRRWDIDPARPTVVCVTRLAHQLKLEGVLAAIEAVQHLPASTRPQLVIVGGGPAEGEVHARAAAANDRCGDRAVVLTGELIDPRPAYAVADVAVGMGGSALRAMAFGVPLIVQGENGFFQTLTPQTLPDFLWTGWYGYGTDAAAGATTLVALLQDLLPDAGLRRELGEFGRRTVEQRFSIDAAAVAQEAFYRDVLGRRPMHNGVDDLRSLTGLGRYHATRITHRILGNRASDDFNSRPVARAAAEHGRTGPPGDERVLLYFAGGDWDEVDGTDKHLVRALAAHLPVVWVDPAESIVRRRRNASPAPLVSSVFPRVTRIHPVAPPGVTRPGVRALTTRLVNRHVRRELSRAGTSPAIVVAAGLDAVLGDWPAATGVYFVTDDYVEGAALLGLSATAIARAQQRNLIDADLVVAVSQPLADSLRAPVPAHVLANACEPTAYAGMDQLAPAEDVTLTGPIAGLVGQLNDRLDLRMLEAVADAGDSLLLVGPRSERSADTAHRLDALLRRPNVQWVGRRPFTDLPRYLRCITVGLTPYADTGFNRSSFPLKTLEYLAAGRAVVSTDLPAARSLHTEHVDLAADAETFAARVHQRLQDGVDPAAADSRRRYVENHSWAHRAVELLQWCALDPVPLGTGPDATVS